MVSLGDTSRSSGGHFFSQDFAPNQDDEFCERTPIFVDPQQRFPRILSIFTTVLILILLILCLSLAFVLPQLCHAPGSCLIDSWSSLVCLQAGTWGLLLVLDQFFRCQYRKIRQCGHLQFYRRTQNLKRSALFVFSAGNALMLVNLVILEKFCNVDGSICFHSLNFERINYIQLLITTEVLLSFLTMIVYLVQLIKLVRRRLLPDATQDDLLANEDQFRVPRSGIGYRDEEDDDIIFGYYLYRDEDDVDIIIEQQADVIQYLKQHNATLGKKIVQLTDELRSQTTA